MTNSILSEIEVDALKTANIVSDISRNNADEPLQLRQRVKEYVDTEEGRVLVIDRDGELYYNQIILDVDLEKILKEPEYYPYYKALMGVN